MSFIDKFLNNITMYRLILYYLLALLVVSAVFGFFGILPYSPFSIIFSTFFILIISLAASYIFATVFKSHTNIESAYVTALILALIITPTTNAAFLGWAAILAMASKYILAIGKKHIFNPAALTVAITALAINQSASWWIGTLPMLPFVLVGGLLLAKKIKKHDMVISFLLTAVLTILVFGFFKGTNLFTLAQKSIVDSPMLFFAFVMLTEPLTTPPTNTLQVFYGALVGLLFAPQIHFGSIYSTPELALIIGNIFSYLVSPKTKLILKLKEKIQIAPDIYDFVFSVNKKLNFTPGQYMEWTLGHNHSDSRGNRRYFTLASSPTEDNLRIGVKFYDNSSSFKKSMLNMDNEREIVASQIAGDFTLQKDKNQKLVFIAGGIGITPFRSIIKYLIDKNESRDIVLFYTNKNETEIVYEDLFNQAKDLGIKTVYVLTDKENIPNGWMGKVGRINEEMIEEEVSDFKERIFYLSGPHFMVTGFEEVLKNMGVNKNQIKTDFFPGFA